MQQITPLKNSKHPFFVGIDVGGTNTKIGIVDDLGQTLAYDSIPTNEELGPADCLERSGATVRAAGRVAGHHIGRLEGGRNWHAGSDEYSRRG